MGDTPQTWLIGLAVLALLNLVLLTLVWRRSGSDALAALQTQQALDKAALLVAVQTAQREAREGSERLERELRREMGEGSREARQELVQNLTTFQQTLLQQSAEATRTQNSQIDAFSQQLTLLQKTVNDTLATQLASVSEANARRMVELRETLDTQLGSFAQQLTKLSTSTNETLMAQLSGLSETNARRMAEVRETLERQLAAMQTSNTAKLEEMRVTVDEKLQSTLHARLGESFKQVADRLEQVHKGLGEMQTLAAGVGDLKHLLTNVKTRGIFGEAQLAALLEQVLVPDQYSAQVPTRPGSKNVVDFAVKLPGKGEDGHPVWLPIDAKFPNEDYERLLDAQARADVVAADAAAKALEARIRLEAKSIGEKYIEPPHTTDFAILFLPTEGLYAEVLRRPGLMESLQRDHRITLAGPTTLLAMLSSLQMGFRTLALEKRSSEVWQVLGAVKTEFGKFGDVLAKVKNQTQTVLNTLDSAEVRSRAMNRALRQVQALPEAQAQTLLPLDAAGDTDA
ncbi:DNA recombination protein RmuC [Curvibacter sp. APW13]|nr:DNA recombination protein RmuC [Curvibacter sp. APW13]MDT8992142.1 DNA recombination protein RmuC [Curvibacter sp. APW13]